MTAAGILQERTGQAVCARTGTARPGWGGRHGASGGRGSAEPRSSSTRLSPPLSPERGPNTPCGDTATLRPAAEVASGCTKGDGEQQRAFHGSEDRSFESAAARPSLAGQSPSAATGKRHAHAPPRHARCLAGVSCFFLKELLKPALAEQHQNAPASQSWVALAEQDTARAEREEEPKPGCRGGEATLATPQTGIWRVDFSVNRLRQPANHHPWRLLLVIDLEKGLVQTDTGGKPWVRRPPPAFPLPLSSWP